jgi:hypothetical protein
MTKGVWYLSVTATGQINRTASLQILEWNSSTLCLIDRIEQLYFLFGDRIKIERSDSVPCLIQEFELKDIKKVYGA